MKEKTIEVIIIDKTVEIGTRIQQHIEESSLQSIVCKVVDGEGAFSYLKNNRADVIILDIDLSNNVWLKLLFQIRISHADAIIIALSNRPYEHYRKLCQAFNIDLFFDKTNEFEKLPAVISSLYKIS